MQMSDGKHGASFGEDGLVDFGVLLPDDESVRRIVGKRREHSEKGYAGVEIQITAR